MESSGKVGCEVGFWKNNNKSWTTAGTAAISEREGVPDQPPLSGFSHQPMRGDQLNGGCNR